MLDEAPAAMRSHLKEFTGLVLGKRPFGLARLGSESLLEWPRNLQNKEAIRIGDRTLIRSHSFIHAISDYSGNHYQPRIDIGNDVYIGRYVYLTACDRIVISDGCVLSEHVYIADLTHGFYPQKGLIMRQHLESKGAVYLGPNCFLGYRATVMQGVSLGEWCIVGANSVVTRGFPPYSMIAGVPAKLIKVFSQELQQWIKPALVAEKVDDEN